MYVYIYIYIHTYTRDQVLLRAACAERRAGRVGCRCGLIELSYSYPYPCPEELFKLHTVPICCLKVFYKLAWAWAWV